MAQKFKGLFVEISAEDEKFQKAIKQVNKSTNQSTKYLKTLDKQITESFDPDDLSSFNKGIEATEDILKTLNKQSKTVENSLKDLEKAGKIDTAEYNDALISLENINTATIKAEKQQRKYTKAVNDIDSGNLDDLDNEYKRLIKTTSELEDDTSSLTDSFDSIDVGGLAGDFLEAGKAGEVLSAGFEAVSVAGGLAASGIGLVVVGVKEYIEYSKDLREANKYVEASINQTGVASEKASKQTVKFARTLDLEVAEAAEITTEAIQDYGDAIQTTGQLTAAQLSVMAQSELGAFDAGEAYAAASANTAAFGDDLADANETIGKSNYLMQAYGARADDIIDTQREWSDTFAATGQTSDQMFKIINGGLAAGARNTDEVANSWNEFLLRLGDGTAEDAISSIGLSYDETVKQFNEGSYSAQEAFLDVVAALFEVEDVTQRTAYAAEIFGTQGEEMLSVMNITSEGAQTLADRVGALGDIQTQVNDVVSKGTGFWQKYAQANGLTSTEVENLRYKIEQQGLSSVDSATKNAVLVEALHQMAESSGFTDQEMANLDNTLGILNGTFSPLFVSTSEFADGLDSLHNSGALSKNAMDLLNEAMVRFKDEGLSLTNQEVNNLTQNFKEMQSEGDIGKVAMQQLSEQLTILGDNSSSSDEKIGALHRTVNVLGAEAVLSQDDVAEMNAKITDLGSSSSTTEEKIDDLQFIIGKLSDANVLNAENAAKASQKLDDLSSSASTGTTSEDGLANKVANANKEMEEQHTTLSELTGIFINAQGPMAQVRIENQLGAERYEELTGKAVDAKGAIEGVTDANGRALSPLDMLSENLYGTSEAFQTTTEDAGDTESAIDDVDGSSAKPEVDDSSVTEAKSNAEGLASWWQNWTPGPKSLKATVQQTTVPSDGSTGPVNPNSQSVATQFTPLYRGQLNTPTDMKSNHVQIGDVIVQVSNNSDGKAIAEDVNRKLREMVEIW